MFLYQEFAREIFFYIFKFSYFILYNYGALMIYSNINLIEEQFLYSFHAI